MIRKLVYLHLFILFSLYGTAQAVPDSLQDNPVVKVHLENDIVKTGYLIYDNETEIKIWSADFGFLKIQKFQIKKIEYLNESNTDTKVAEEDVHAHHYIVSNSSFLPAKGDVYLRTPYMVNACLDYGIASDLTIGVGAFYFVAMNANLRYNIKFSETARMSLAGGFYYSYLGKFTNSNTTMASFRGTFTLGTPSRNITFGGSYLTNFNRVEMGYASVSSISPLSGRTFFVTDIMIAPDLRPLQLDLNYMALGFMGIRVKTKRGNRIDVGFASLIFEAVNYNWSTNQESVSTYFIPLPFGQLSLKL